jgi:hypothetical protein
VIFWAMCNDNYDVLADGVVVGRIIKITRGTGGRAMGVGWSFHAAA